MNATDTASEASVSLPVEASPPLHSTEAVPPAAHLTRWETLSFGLAHRLTAGLLAIFGLGGLYRFGRVFGTVEWLINFKRRKRFARALAEILPSLTSKQRRHHTREHFMQTRCDKMFYLIFDCIPRETALASLTIMNQELLDKALSSGRGAYVALCHHGPHHVSGLLMVLRGYKIAGVRDRKEGAIRRYVQSLYDRKYPEFERVRILYSDSFPREIYRCLKEGFALASAMDISRIRDPKQKYEEVECFGRPQPFLSGPLRIALRCNAPILQSFIVPGKAFHYQLDIKPLLEPRPGEDEDQAVRRALETYASNIEQYVKKSPSLLSRT